MNCKLSRNAKRAIAKYGEASCKRAFHEHAVNGEGGFYVGVLLGLKVNQANAAINAGRELEVKS